MSFLIEDKSVDCVDVAHDHEVISVYKHFVMGLAGLCVEASPVLFNFASCWVNHVHTRMVAELILSSNYPQFVTLVQHLTFTQGYWSSDGREFEIGCVTVIPVENFNCVGDFSLNILSSDHKEFKVSFLLPQLAASILARNVETVAEFA